MSRDPLVAELANGLLRRVPEWLAFHTRVNDAPLGAYLARRRQLHPGDARPAKDDGRRLS